MAKNDCKKILNGLFNFPLLGEKETSYFKGYKHDQLLDTFNEWFRIKCLIQFDNVSSVDIQGIHDKGMDLIFEIKMKDSLRIGIQIKSYGDIANKSKERTLEKQINETLANEPTFNLDYVIIIFCGDYSDQSQKTKVKKQISRINSLPNSGKFILVEPRRAVKLFKELFPIWNFLLQFKEISGVPDKFEFEIVEIKKDKSGFPIIVVESSLFSKGKFYVSLLKSYLHIIMGILAPEVLRIGYYDSSKIILGICPLGESVSGGIFLGEGKQVALPDWFIVGLEEHGPIGFWGSFTWKEGSKRVEWMLSFYMTQAVYEKGQHYQLIANKFELIAGRLKNVRLIKYDK